MKKIFAITTAVLFCAPAWGQQTTTPEANAQTKAAALEFASGVLGTLTVSFEASGRYESGMFVHGTAKSATSSPIMRWLSV